MTTETSNGAEYPISVQDDSLIWAELQYAFAAHPRFPDWPFTFNGQVAFCAFNDVLDGDFGIVLRTLCDEFGDDYIIVGSTDSEGERREGGKYPRSGLFPLFKLRTATLTAQTYRNAIVNEPGGLYLLSIWPGVGNVMIAGESRQWAVWAEATPELAVVCVRSGSLQWRGVAPNVAFVDIKSALSRFVDLTYVDEPMPAEDRIRYLSNFAGK